MVDPPQNNTADSSILSGTSDAPVNNVTRRFRVLRIVNTGSLSQVDAGEGASAAAATHPAQGHSTASTPSFPQAARANQAPRAPSAAQPAQPSRSALQSSSSNSAAQPYVNPRARFQDPSTRNAFMSQGASGNPPGLTPNGARVNPTGSAPNNDGAVPSSKNPDTSLGFSGFPKEDLPREWLSAICKFCGPNGGAVKACEHLITSCRCGDDRQTLKPAC
ncbi:MAG: hypothetical protein MMC23_000034 [Stictis urceolatum]|nr:hypothetical protein [Stictis urceolata]